MQSARNQTLTRCLPGQPFRHGSPQSYAEGDVDFQTALNSGPKGAVSIHE